MYDFPPLQAVTDVFWSAIAARLRAAGVADVPPALTPRHEPHRDLVDPRLLFGQACQYPLAKSRHEGVRLVAIPEYSAPGCEGSRYRSAIIVRASGPLRVDSRTFAAGAVPSTSPIRTAASNLLRAAVAPARRGGPVLLVGRAHRRTPEERITSVASGNADVAAIDCVTYAHIGRLPSGARGAPEDPRLDSVEPRVAVHHGAHHRLDYRHGHCEARSAKCNRILRSRRCAPISCRAASISQSTKVTPRCCGSKPMRSARGYPELA